MNSKRKGGIALVKAIAYYTELGKTVLIPVVDCDKYDLVLDDGSLKKVQCKYTAEKAHKYSYVVDLRTYNGYREKVVDVLYKEGDFDLLFVYTENRNKFIIPFEVIVGKKQITVSGDWKSPYYKYMSQLQVTV